MQKPVYYKCIVCGETKRRGEFARVGGRLQICDTCRKNGGVLRNSPPYFVVYDPDGTFRQGARFTRIEVDEMLTHDCLLDGTVLSGPFNRKVVVCGKRLRKLEANREGRQQ